jgi:thioredoxin-like negative regulator of GroEL
MPSIEQIQQLLAREPGDSFLNFALAMEYVKLQRTDEAVAQFDRVLALNPDYTTAYFQKARSQLAAQRPDAAADSLRAGIARAEALGDHHAAGEMGELLESFR